MSGFKRGYFGFGNDYITGLRSLGPYYWLLLLWLRLRLRPILLLLLLLRLRLVCCLLLVKLTAGLLCNIFAPLPNVWLNEYYILILV